MSILKRKKACKLNYMLIKCLCTLFNEKITIIDTSFIISQMYIFYL
nr:MAG TPA: hypothetical protein [Caudoviricetes sp.]